jgi:hypothetical protein
MLSNLRFRRDLGTLKLVPMTLLGQVGKAKREHSKIRRYRPRRAEALVDTVCMWESLPATPGMTDILPLRGKLRTLFMILCH